MIQAANLRGKLAGAGCLRRFYFALEAAKSKGLARKNPQIAQITQIKKNLELCTLYFARFSRNPVILSKVRYKAPSTKL